MLLFDPTFSDDTTRSYTCDLVSTIASKMDMQADVLYAAWADTFTATLRRTGKDDNTEHLTEDES